MTPTLPAGPPGPSQQTADEGLMITRLFLFLSIHLAVTALRGFNVAISQTSDVVFFLFFFLLQTDRQTAKEGKGLCAAETPMDLNGSQLTHVFCPFSRYSNRV